MGGMSCLAKAIRYGISKSLCCFVSTDQIEKLRLGSFFSASIFILLDFDLNFFKKKLAGLLTKEVHGKERKKPGQEGARRKYTWLVHTKQKISKFNPS
jgi:small subunit ribosomal protein S9